MPTYEYLCEACKKEFEQITTIHEHDEGKIACPKCGSNKIKQLPASFQVVTSKKS
jgi:putative FmdB family regulatory protein